MITDRCQPGVKGVCMELKSLILGLVFTMSVFALKGGVGLHYFLMRERRWRKNLLFLFFYNILYFFVFMLSGLVVKRIDIVRYFEIFQGFLKSGMFIHVLMAIGLVVWGIILLKNKDRSERGSLGWMALVIPCPVCVTVIFVSSAFLLFCFPDAWFVAVLLGYLGFTAMVMITVIGMTLWGAGSDSSPESILGGAMLTIAGYFFLSVIIMPQFSDIDAVYRLASYQGEKQTANTKGIIFFYSAMAVLFFTGFWAMRKRIRRSLF